MTDAYRTVKAEDWADHTGESVRLAFRSGQALALRRLAWDTRFFGLPCFELMYDASTIAPCCAPGAFVLQRAPRCAVWAKIPSGAPAGFGHALEHAGARFMEVELNLRHASAPRHSLAPAGIRILDASDLDVPGYAELGSSFTLTRFHVDPAIGPEKADALWRSYLLSYVPGADRRVFLALDAAGSAVGAILVSLCSNPVAEWVSLDVVAVRATCRGSGAGSALIQVAAAWSASMGLPLLVSTQHRNAVAVNFYVRNGFTVYDPSRVVYHWWTGDAA